MIRRFVPKPVKQSPAVDHLAKFVADELIVDARGFCRLSALHRIYVDWCAMHDVVNRQLPGSILLLELEQAYGMQCGAVYLPVKEGKTADGKQSHIYALRGARLAHPALNARSQRGSIEAWASPKVWQPVIDGITPDQAVSFDASLPDDDIDDE